MSKLYIFLIHSCKCTVKFYYREKESATLKE